MLTSERELTKVQKRLLGILTDQWLDRDALGAALGKTRLNASERERLEELVEMGLAEKTTELRGITEAYLYRAAR